MTRIGVALALVAWLACGTARAETPTVQEIVHRAEDALRGKTAETKLRMTITTPRWTRELVVRSWDDRPNDRSFTRVLDPPKDKGTAFLRDKDAFWTWLPRVERAMRVPPSMMLQPWMGSDFSNDDLARESSLEDDYVPRLVGEGTENGIPVWKIELLPKPEAPVVWAKLELSIARESYAPVLYVYYDEPEPGRFEPLRRLEFGDVRTEQGRPVPHSWVMTPLDKDKEGHSTKVELLEIVFDQTFDPALFTQKNLRQSEGSR